MQILQAIIKKEGIFALYTGLSAALVGTIFSYGIYFWWYRYLKNKFTLYTGRRTFTKIELTIITAISGTLSSFLANPIWMINARMTVRKKEEAKNTSYKKLVSDIYKNEGLWAFYKGVVPNLILVLNPIINFVIYEGLRQIAMKQYKSERLIPFYIIFIMSSIGKIAATFATYPILTIRVQAHTNAFADKDGEKKLNQFEKVLHFVKSVGGIMGLFKGIEAKLIQTIMYNAFLMMVYEKLRLLVKHILFYAVYMKFK